MNAPPLISILIPTYNRAQYLRQAIQSALAQTYAPVEILVLDNASSDETPTVAAEFAQEISVRYLRAEANGGITGNWRRGIEKMQGEFFCLLHDDDTLEPGFVARLAQPLLADDGLVLAFCDHWVMNARGERDRDASDAASRQFRRHALAPGALPDFARSALVDASLCAGAALFRRRLVTPECIRDEAQGSIDLWLFYQCVKTGHGAFYVAERLMNYRAHGGGMSATAPFAMGEGHLFRLRHILGDSSMQPLHADAGRLLAATLTDYGINLLHAGKTAQARGALQEALRLGKTKRALAAYALARGGAMGTRITQTLRRRPA